MTWAVFGFEWMKNRINQILSWLFAIVFGSTTGILVFKFLMEWNRPVFSRMYGFGYDHGPVEFGYPVLFGVASFSFATLVFLCILCPELSRLKLTSVIPVSKTDFDTSDADNIIQPCRGCLAYAIMGYLIMTCSIAAVSRDNELAGSSLFVYGLILFVYGSCSSTLDDSSRVRMVVVGLASISMATGLCYAGVLGLD